MMTMQSSRLVAVSSPGGIARQSRVQVCAAHERRWRWYATYENAQQAELCVEQLQQKGQMARLVEFRCSPASG
jgi:hypothetical protein